MVSRFTYRWQQNTCMKHTCCKFKINNCAGIVFIMSFFIKGKRKNHTKAVENGINKPNKKFKETENDELTSESEHESDEEHDESEDEEETAQEKRLRLAKVYLEEIAKQEKERLNDKDADAYADVSNRLKEDYLKQTGKFRCTVADQYTEADPNYLNILQCKDHKNAVTCICVSSDDKYIFSGSKDGRVVKWLLSDRKKISTIPFIKKSSNSSTIEGHSHPITCISISDDLKFLAVGTESNQIEIWNPETLKHMRTFKHHRNSLMGLVFRKGSHHLYSCSKDGSVKVWTLDEMSYLETLFGHQDSVMAIDALSRERAITAGGMDSSLRIWKIAEESQLIFNGTGTVDCVKLINEENFVSGGDTGELCIWGSMKKKPLCSVKNAHGRDQTNDQPLWVTSVASLVNTDLLASGSTDGTIRLWKLFNSCKSISPIFTIPAVGFVNSLQFTSDGNYLIAGIGREHRCGRWSTIKEAKNGIMIIKLNKSS